MTNKKNRRGSDRKTSIVNDIVSTRVASKVLSNRKQARLFLEQYFSDVPASDLAGRSPDIMAGIAFSHLEFGAQRRKGQAKLRIYTPTEAEHGYASPYTFIELINDDMPFLVNSVTAAINRHDLTVHITVHPIIRVSRNKGGKLESITDLRLELLRAGLELLGLGGNSLYLRRHLLHGRLRLHEVFDQRSFSGSSVSKEQEDYAEREDQEEDDGNPHA